VNTSDKNVRAECVDAIIEAFTLALESNREAMIAAPALFEVSLHGRVGEMVTITMNAYSDPPRAAGIPVRRHESE